MSFQSNAFQSDAFQMDRYSGGSAKFDSEAYAYVYNHADLLRRKQRVDSLPEQVKEVILEAVQQDSEADRARILEARLKAVDAQFKAQYMALMESYYQAMIDAELARLLQEAERRRIIDEQNAIILLLLT